MQNFLIVLSYIFLFQSKPPELEYSLLNQVAGENGIKSIRSEFYSPKDKFRTYGEFSLAFERDILDPTKSFNLDSLFTGQQIRAFEQSLQTEKPRKVKPKMIQAQLSKTGYQLSFPLIQEGKNEEIYGLVFENVMSMESGGVILKLYRKEGKKWTLLHQTYVAIS